MGTGPLPDSPLEWEELLRYCEQIVRGRLVRMGFLAEVVEEAILTTVLRVVQRKTELRPHSVFAYVWQTAYHCAVDQVRSVGRQCSLDMQTETGAVVEVICPGPSPEKQAILKHDIQKCINQLGATERAIVLHKAYGLSAKEIAVLIGITSEASVNTRFSGACKFLRECLRPVCVHGPEAKRRNA
jgi:DNA-directed RNA polymerase specialized sigma24 family protein